MTLVREWQTYHSDTIIRSAIRHNLIGQERYQSPRFYELGRTLSRLLAERADSEDICREVNRAPQYLRYRLICAMSDRGYSIVVCEHCGEASPEDQSSESISHGFVCARCAEEHYVYSEPEWALVYNDRAVTVYRPDGSWYFASDEWASENATLDDEDGNYYEQPPFRNRIYRYHEGPEIGHIKSEKYSGRTPRVLLGVELEVESVYEDREQNASDILDAVNSKEPVAKAEYDGSLRHGFEIITGYTGLDVHEKIIKAITSCYAAGNLRSHDTDTCGLHVHIDKAGITAFEAAKLQLFVYDPANRPLIEAIARRYNTDYCEAKEKKDVIADAVEAMGMSRASHRFSQLTNSNRYQGLNFLNERTIEFRLFRGTLNVERYMACLEFAWLAYWFAREAGISQLNTKEFLRFACRKENAYESRYLRKLLARKGWVLPKTSTGKEKACA